MLARAAQAGAVCRGRPLRVTRVSVHGGLAVHHPAPPARRQIACAREPSPRALPPAARKQAQPLQRRAARHGRGGGGRGVRDTSLFVRCAATTARRARGDAAPSPRHFAGAARDEQDEGGAGGSAAGHRGLDAYTHSTARRAPRAARRVGGRVPIDVSPAHAPFLPRLPPAPVLSRLVILSVP